MSAITKEQLRERAREKVKSLEFAVTQKAFADSRADLEVELELARIALASLEAEPVAYIIQDADARSRGEKGILRYFANISDEDINEYQITVTPLYNAPPAPVSVPDYPETLPCPVMLEPGLRFGKGVPTKTMLGALQRRAEHYAELEAMTPEQRAKHDAGMKEFAAMLQGAEPVTTAYKLPDEFDFDRFNDVVWLEAVASNPHMHSPTTSTIAMVALELNKKLADGKHELTVWYGSMPESNGKANWTAILHRKGEGRCMDGFTIDRSEYPGRVLYAADRVRYLIGEKSERPSILDYDADAHSGYVEPVTTAYKLRDAVETIRNSGIEINAEKIFAERDALNAPDCWCRTCRPITLTDMRFVVCPDCGNKRCPHANDHRNACTGSNEPGQEGSAYPAAPQQEA
ncbi:hypothetical protein [Enterobacter asburiae]|uniref:hypothetical protein n=1 Tax=Enterobacter asburiae TaxID=61645 RepID=UPI0034CEE668